MRVQRFSRHRLIALLIVSTVAFAFPGRLRAQAVPRPDAPQEWVAFSADIRINIPNRPEAWGRYVQDEHGCVRQEMVHPDGSALVTITNFETERFYRLYHGSWTAQPMRTSNLTRRPIQLRVDRKTDPIEGYDAYVSVSNVRSPRGDYKEEVAVIPALNFFRAAFVTPSGERRTAANIRVGPQAPEQFLPPPGAAVAEEPGFGGFMSFSAVELRIVFAGGTPIDVTTTEENAYTLKTPSGIPLSLVTSVVDKEKNVVRIRVLQDATGRPGDIRGNLVEELQAALGATVQTTKLGESFSVTVTRVGSTRAR